MLEESQTWELWVQNSHGVTTGSHGKEFGRGWIEYLLMTIELRFFIAIKLITSEGQVPITVLFSLTATMTNGYQIFQVFRFLD